MEKQNIENIKDKIKGLLKQLSFYTIISISFAAGISIGYYYDYIKTTYSKRPQVVSVRKAEVKLAMDENNNLLIIQKNDGTYIMYQDSIALQIFNMYAKSIYKPATPTN